MDELETKLRGAVEPLLEPGENLLGVCVASQVSLFKGRQVALATTELRIVVQGLTRKFERDGEPVSITPDRLADASAEGAGVREGRVLEASQRVLSRRRASAGGRPCA